MKHTLFFLGLCFVLAGCQQQAVPETSQATDADEVKKEAHTAISDYLATRQDLNLANMDLEVTDVTVEGETAVAQVRFRSKQGNAEMPMSYRLRREEGHWVVQRPSGGGQMPAGHPPTSTDPPPAH